VLLRKLAVPVKKEETRSTYGYRARYIPEGRKERYVGEHENIMILYTILGNNRMDCGIEDGQDVVPIKDLCQLVYSTLSFKTVTWRHV
jgi:hypothetical protein